jgi:hypothetical protein
MLPDHATNIQASNNGNQPTVSCHSDIILVLYLFPETAQFKARILPLVAALP